MCGFQFKNNAYWNIVFVEACFSLSNLPRVANILITIIAYSRSRSYYFLFEFHIIRPNQSKLSIVLCSQCMPYFYLKKLQ